MKKLQLDAKVIGRLTGLVLGLLAAWGLVLLLGYDLSLVRAPVQLEYREGAILQTTQLLLDGANPYAAANQPADTNSYGIFYHLVMLPLARAFGNSFMIHRLVSGLCILAAGTFIVGMLAQRKASPSAALASGVLVAANLLFYTTPFSRPDGLGEMLFLLAAFLPWAGRYSRLSLAVSVVLGVLAFFTKFYFALGAGYAAGYLLFSRRYRAFFFYCLGFGLLLAASALVVARVFPFYFYDTFYNHLGIAGKKLDFFLYQSTLYLVLYASAFLLLAGLGIALIRRLVRRQLSLGAAWAGLDFPLVGLGCSLVVVGGSMGWVPGTLMVYYLQLITPFLVVLLVEVTRGRARLAPLAEGCLMVCLYGNLVLLGLNPFDGRSAPWTVLAQPVPSAAEWALIRERISSSQQIYNSPVMAGEMVAARREVYDNGHTEYYFLTMQGVPDFLLLPPGALVAQRGHDFLDRINRQITDRSFDWIVITRDDKGNLMSKPPAGVSRTYQKVDELVIQMPQAFQTWTLEFWVPQP